MSGSVGRITRSFTAAVTMAAISGMLVATSAFATGGTESYNNVALNIAGGDAAAISACVNIAQSQANVESTTKGKKGNKAKKRVLQGNFCKNVAVANGGDVTLKNVSLTILQGDGSTTSVNNATINISGGDALAVAACVNYAEGDASIVQTNVCKNLAAANGGDVTLKNVDIFVIQA